MNNEVAALREALDITVDALERIALGIAGRRSLGLRDDERGGHGLANQAQPDWKLAADALAQLAALNEAKEAHRQEHRQLADPAFADLYPGSVEAS